MGREFSDSRRAAITYLPLPLIYLSHYDFRDLRICLLADEYHELDEKRPLAAI